MNIQSSYLSKPVKEEQNKPKTSISKEIINTEQK